MDPYSAVIGGVLEAAQGAMSALPYMVQTQYDIDNKKRLKQLKKLQELDQLGLSEEEKQAYWGALNRAGEAARSQIQNQSEANLQAFNTNAAGHQLAMAKLGEEQLARTQTDIGARVQIADQQRADAMAQELEDRLAYKASRDRQMAAAVSSILMPVLASASEGGALQSTAGKKTKKDSQKANADKTAPIEGGPEGEKAQEGEPELDDETKAYLGMLGGF